MRARRIAFAGSAWLLVGIWGAFGQEASPPSGSLTSSWDANEQAGIPAVQPRDIEPRSRPTLAKRILWYAPNRVLDLLDIFRLRLRIGPGLAANFRITDFGAFYVGSYQSVYVGLPGPRHPHVLRPPVGLESLRGIVMAGVDATDDTPHGPEYGAAEIDVGLHLLLVGGEAGVDAVEIGDFLGGWIGMDPMEDDFPVAAKVPPEMSSGVVYVPPAGPFAVDAKPSQFSSLSTRLDYLHANVQRRVSEPVRFTDAYFAQDPEAPMAMPQTQFRLGIYAELRQGKDFELNLAPELDMDIELPNIEQRLRVFVESAKNNALPQASEIDEKDTGFDVGARKYFDKLDISLDAGVRATWLPEAFARITWRDDWRWGPWNVEPEQRLFYETDDKFGFRSSLFGTCWVGRDLPFVIIPDVSVKWASEKKDFEWGASVKFMRVQRLLDERRRGRFIGWDDTAVAQGMKASVTGRDSEAETYRTMLGFRGPLYRKWIYWEIDPGLEWQSDEDFDMTFVVRMGIDLLFWGHAYE